MFPHKRRAGAILSFLVLALLSTLLVTGCGGGSSTRTGGSNPGGPGGPVGGGGSLGVGEAPQQSTFLYGTYGPTILAGRLSANGTITDVPMPTDSISGDTGFQTGTDGYVNSIATDPTGRFVYTLDVQTSSFGIPIGKNGIGAFTVDRTSGELKRIPGSPYPVNVRGGSVVEDGTGMFLFIAGSKTSTIDTYSIDQGSGALTQTTTLTNAAGEQLAASWDGRFLFDAGNGQINTYSIAPATGALTQVSTVSVDNSGPIFLSYSGKFLYSVSNSGISTVSVGSNGQLAVTQQSFPAPQAAGGLPRGMIATSRDDRFAYVGTSAGDNVGTIQAYTVDPATGILGVPVGSPVTMQVGQSPLQLTLDYNGKFLYATFTGINLQSYPVNTDGSIGAGITNTGVSAIADFFELSP